MIEVPFAAEILIELGVRRRPGEGGLLAGQTACEEVDSDPVKDDPEEFVDVFDVEARGLSRSTLSFEIVVSELVGLDLELVREQRLRASTGDGDRFRLSMSMLWRAERWRRVEERCTSLEALIGGKADM
jgi:hypothetical protein